MIYCRLCGQEFDPLGRKTSYYCGTCLSKKPGPHSIHRKGKHPGIRYCIRCGEKYEDQKHLTGTICETCKINRIKDRIMKEVFNQ